MHGNSLALGARIRGYSYNPLTHAAFACRWGNGAPKAVTGPRQRLRQVMDAIGERLTTIPGRPCLHGRCCR